MAASSGLPSCAHSTSSRIPHTLSQPTPTKHKNTKKHPTSYILCLSLHQLNTKTQYIIPYPTYSVWMSIFVSIYLYEMSTCCPHQLNTKTQYIILHPTYSVLNRPTSWSRRRTSRCGIVLSRVQLNSSNFYKVKEKWLVVIKYQFNLHGPASIQLLVWYCLEGLILIRTCSRGSDPSVWTGTVFSWLVHGSCRSGRPKPAHRKLARRASTASRSQGELEVKVR